MSADTMPRFGHLQDYWVYEGNVRAGRPLCERCDGGGNEFFGMYRACAECGGSGIDPSWSPPPPPRPWELSDVGGASCPTSWPEWATTEDCDIVWVRADLEQRAEEIAAPALDADVNLMLARRGREAMVLDLVETDWSGDWMLRAAALEADPQDACVYVEYEVVYAEHIAPSLQDGGE